MAIGSMSDAQIAARDAALAAANNGRTVNTGTTGSLSGDFNFFLKMLTTQLQNQDPTEPMDVTQMTQQIAQYSGVEQQVRTNTMLEQLLTANRQSELSTAVGYIGKEVETEGNVSTLQYAQNGGLKGTAEFTYTLPADVASAEITIVNAAGETVFKGTGPVAEGSNKVMWDGVNSTTNKQVPAGNYTMQVVAKDAAGNSMGAVSTGGAASLTYATAQYGQAVFSYMLPSGAQNAKITILNASGQAVFTGDGTLKTGRNVVVWDGVNSFNGNESPAGKYTIQVTAKDAAGKDITVETRAVGTVSTVENGANGSIILNVGDAQVKYEDILAVREATPFYVPEAPEQES
jgi:flagellar basal-body rod modification protein FlgD